MNIIIIEENIKYEGSHILHKLSKDLNGSDKNYLYFPFNRKFGISKMEMESFNIAYKLSYNLDFLDSMEKVFDIKDPFSYEECDLDMPIKNGYMQLLNIIYQVLIKHPDILIIDDFGKNLHPLLEIHLIAKLRQLNKNKPIKQLIITTTNNKVVKQYGSYLINTQLYINLRSKLFDLF